MKAKEGRFYRVVNNHHLTFEGYPMDPETIFKIQGSTVVHPGGSTYNTGVELSLMLATLQVTLDDGRVKKENHNA
jgi:hypothetical protein